MSPISEALSCSGWATLLVMGVGHCLVMGESFLVYGLGKCLGDDLDSHLQGGGWIHCLAMCVPLSCEGEGIA